MVRKEIITQKTARYYILGEPSKTTKTVWFVCHGYGQLANDFLNNFEVLQNNQNLIVSPEGLHRFYLSGVTGNVGASWMTKEERRNDIIDHIAFLNKVYNAVMKEVTHKNVNVVGFSQGTATVCRWLVSSKIKVSNLILWGGEIPADIDILQFRSTFKSTKVWLVAGNKDPFIVLDKLKKEIEVLEKNNITYELVKYKGKHEIKQDILLQLNKRLI